MKKLTPEMMQDIINTEIYAMLKRLRHLCSPNSGYLLWEDTRYPVFRPYPKDAVRYVTYIKKMESYIQEYLVHNVLSRILTEVGVLEARLGIYMIVREGVHRVGFFTSIPDQTAKYMAICRQYGIRQSWIIDWPDVELLESNRSPYETDEKYQIPYITLKAFFVRYFDISLYQQYIEVARKAVSMAYNEIGYRVIPTTSGRNMSIIKASLYEELKNGVEDDRYKKIGEPGRYIQITGNKAEKDKETISRRFSEEKLYQSFYGTGDFAKCYISSEYLYHAMDNEGCHYMDYTSVVAGYFKSIEILLLRLVKASLLSNNEKEKALFIACDVNAAKKDGVDDKDIKDGRIRFTKEYEKYFKTEMGYLTQFIAENKTGWYVSKDTKNMIKTMLDDYRRTCRNDHFHKDVLDRPEELAAIRHNTILCAYYLLGAYRITGSGKRDREYLECVDDTYDHLYRALAALPRDIYFFRIQFPDSDLIMSYRLFKQEEAAYDQYDNIISPIKFSRIKKFSSDYVDQIERNLSESPVFNISREHYPVKIYYEDDDGSHELHW